MRCWPCNLDEVRAWLAPQLEKGGIELSVVGDFELEATIAAVAQTLGALPPREAQPLTDEMKRLAFPAQPFAKEYRVDTEIPRGLIRTYWPTTDGIEVTRTRRLGLLGSIVSDRLRVKIREEVGAAYSPQAGSIESNVSPGYGYILTHVEIDPAMVDKVTKLVLSIGDDLAANGVNDDELKRAREPILKSMEQSLRDNGYWLNSVLARAQEKPEVLDWSRTRVADLASITTGELTALAKKYLTSDRASQAIILPAAKPAAAPKP
jgi:zinc protease